MIKLRVYCFALGVMCHVEVILSPEDEPGNARNM